MRATRFVAPSARTLDDTVAEELLDAHPNPITPALLALGIYGADYSAQQEAEVERALGRLMATGRARVAEGSAQ